MGRTINLTSDFVVAEVAEIFEIQGCRNSLRVSLQVVVDNIYHGLIFHPTTMPSPKHHRAVTSGFCRA